METRPAARRCSSWEGSMMRMGSLDDDEVVVAVGGR